MNLDAIFSLIPAMALFLFLFGVYKAFFEKRFLAQEYVGAQLGPNKPGQRGGTAGLTLSERQISILRERSKDQRPFVAKVQMQLDRANLMFRATEFIGMALLATTAVIILGMVITQNFPLSVLLGFVTFFLPLLYLKIRIALRMARAHDEFPDVIDTMVSCFKTGYGFNRSAQSVTENFKDPWGTEFGRMVVEMNLGSKQEAALKDLYKRVPLPEVDLFTTALLIQKETGGNMVEMLKNLSDSIRCHHKLKRKIKTLSAQGQISVIIVSLVPPLMCYIMYLSLGQTVTDFITSPIGAILSILAAIWMLIGVFVLTRIIKIEV